MFQKGKVTSEDKQKLFLFVLFRKGSEAMLKVFFSFGGGAWVHFECNSANLVSSSYLLGNLETMWWWRLNMIGSLDSPPLYYFPALRTMKSNFEVPSFPFLFFLFFFESYLQTLL